MDGIGKEAPSSPSSLYVYGQDDWVRGDKIDGEGKTVVPAASDWKRGLRDGMGSGRNPNHPNPT